jgi:transcriptional regulator with XRE-family HTH domain
MRRSKSHDALPLPALLALKRLGAGIAAARKLRGITASLMAERAMISRNTLSRVEKGDPGVALGTYASVLFVLGLANRFDELLADDSVTQDRMMQLIPKRARSSLTSGKSLVGA